MICLVLLSHTLTNTFASASYRALLAMGTFCPIIHIAVHVPVLQGLKAEIRCQINRTQGQIWAIIYFWTHAYCVGTLVFIPAFLDKCFFYMFLSSV